MADDKSTEYVTLVSNDGYEFKILRSAACIAGTIKKALDPMCTQPVTHQMKVHMQS
jgi:transcription elongation factor B subunit 1